MLHSGVRQQIHPRKALLWSRILPLLTIRSTGRICAESMQKMPSGARHRQSAGYRGHGRTIFRRLYAGSRETAGSRRRSVY
ncbi:hypothetical protein FYJ85_11170 [Victivallaceae bacterium BBE-744-WT-12]|uniref:Uncharacterized protein n=1 Tax=Victivallis lenta TaxID=2606640 RepID=A0A844G521_9BACT|nr:hypothetical protein [Victivallis lenta]